MGSDQVMPSLVNMGFGPGGTIGLSWRRDNKGKAQLVLSIPQPQTADEDENEDEDELPPVPDIDDDEVWQKLVDESERDE